MKETQKYYSWPICILWITIFSNDISRQRPTETRKPDVKIISNVWYVFISESIHSYWANLKDEFVLFFDGNLLDGLESLYICENNYSQVMADHMILSGAYTDSDIFQAAKTIQLISF